MLFDSGAGGDGTTLSPMATKSTHFPELSDEELDRVHGGDRGFVAREVSGADSDALDGEGDALPDADAHRAKRIASRSPRELARGGGDQPRPRRSERMT